MLSFLAFSNVFAVEINNGEEMDLTNKINEDAYVFSPHAWIDGDVNGDLFLSGSNVVINGDVSEDLLVIAPSVTLNGNVAQDARIIAKTAIIIGNIGDDLVLTGGVFYVDQKVTIGGNLIAAATDLQFYGELKDQMVGIYGNLEIGGILNEGGDLMVNDMLFLGKGNQILKPFYYTTIGSFELIGEETDNIIEKDNVKTLGIFKYFEFWISLVLFIANSLIGLFIVYFFPKFVRDIGMKKKEDIVKLFSNGLVTSVVLGLTILFLTISIVGIPVAVMVLTVFGFLIAFSSLFASSLVYGYLYPRKRTASKKLLFQSILLGLMVYHSIGLFPIIGHLIQLFLSFIGIGTFITYMAHILRPKRAKSSS